jgi:hypothetical protein
LSLNQQGSIAQKREARKEREEECDRDCFETRHRFPPDCFK